MNGIVTDLSAQGRCKAREGRYGVHLVSQLGKIWTHLWSQWSVQQQNERLDALTPDSNVVSTSTHSVQVQKVMLTQGKEAAYKLLVKSKYNWPL